MSIIADWLSKAFGKTEYRVLTWGFYGGGSTTGLYKLKLGETVSTIPTIGFNVETVPVKGGISMTMWDLGGRDRIRPLWRHYFQNTQGLIFYVDSGIRDPEHHQFMRDELDRFLCEDELRGVPVLICANKQDGPKPMTGTEVAEVLRLNAIRGRPWYVQETCALTGEGLQEGIAWLAQALKGEKSTPTLSERARQAGSEWLAGVFQQGKAMTTPSGTAAEKAKSSDDSQDQPQQQPAKETSGAPSAASKQKQKSAGEARQEALLTGLLQSKDEVSDDDFLAGIEHKTLDPWDHLTLLRLIWLLLSRHGRRSGKDQLFKSLEDLRRDAEAFHVTIAYFWMHMVHYAMTATLNPTGDLKGLLVLNPQLCDAQLVQMYYSEGLLSVSPEAKSEVVLPDKKPLPSVITKMDVKKGPQEKEGQQGSSAPNASEQDDEDYLDQLHDRTLRSWGHEAKLRAIWLLLRKHGRRQGGTSKVLQALQDFEGAAHNVTESYFWVQMVTLRAAEAPACAGYAAFIARPSCKPLIQPNLILDYYSSEALDQGAAEFRLPDKQQLPSTVKKQ